MKEPSIGSWSRLGTCLLGVIRNHPQQEKFKDDWQITSPVVEMNEEEGWVRTENTLYKLGKPHGGTND